MGTQKISFQITLCSQVLNLGKIIATVLVLAIFVLEPKMIMSHQADLVDGCGAGGRPSDYLSSSLSKGTSHTYVEMLIFVRLIIVKMLIVKKVQC